MNKLAMGAIAGAAGTLALDLASYGDMAFRGRSSSNLPAEIIRRSAEFAGLETLARPDEEADTATKNRRRALGALSGYTVGIVTGMVLFALPKAEALPWPLLGILTGGAAMAAADAPAAVLGATDPASWSTSDWLSDVIPHLAYGLVAAVVFRAVAKG